MDADWLEYEWEWEGIAATYRVDKRYHGLLPSLRYTYRIKIIISPADEAFTQKEMRRIDELVGRLCESLNSAGVYVGGVAQPQCERHFFYTGNAEAAAQLSQILKSETKLKTRIIHGYEENHSAYYQLLFPDDCKWQSIDNAEFLQKLNKSEEECALAHRVCLTFAFSSIPALDVFCEKLTKSAFWVDDLHLSDHKTHPYCVTVHGFCPLILQKLNRFTTRAIMLAIPTDGVLTNVSGG